MMVNETSALPKMMQRQQEALLIIQQVGVLDVATTQQEKKNMHNMHLL